MRWAENRGMPVHRFPGSKQARVFAYQGELASWLESFDHPDLDQVSGSFSQKAADDQGNPFPGQSDKAGMEATPSNGHNGQGPGGAEHPAIVSSIAWADQAPSSFFFSLKKLESEGDQAKDQSLASALWFRRWSIAAVVGILVLLMGIVAVLQPGAKSAAGVRAAGLVQLTSDGRFKEDLRTDGMTLFFNESAGTNRTLASVSIEGGPVRPIPMLFGNAVLADVSPDGKTLLITAPEGIDPNGQLWKLPAQGGTPTKVGQVHCAFARWSPDNKQIAFTVGNHLYLTDPEGHEPHLVWSFDAKAVNIIWSPDGRRIRVVAQNEMTLASTSWEIDSGDTGAFDGSVAVKLPLHTPCCTDWTWTGDGRDFAYVVAQNVGEATSHLGDQRLFRTGRWGTPQELSIDLGRIQSLASGKNGSRLYFLISNTNRGELLRYNARERSFQNYLPGLSAEYLSFSHDGQWMSYSLTQDRSLWRSRADGSQALRVVGPPMEVALSSWSPDGSQIAFMGRLPGKPWRIYLVGRDGGTPREAAMGDDSQGAPTWSPDGMTIAYGRVYCEADNSCGIFLVDLETGRVRTLPDSEKFRTARWSPDGKYIAAMQRDNRGVQLFDLKEHRWQKLAEDMSGDDISWSKDSQALYFSCIFHEHPSIDKVRISDHSRSTVVDLKPLQKMAGQLISWFGLAPDESPIVFHLYTSTEVYALNSSEP